MVPLNFLPNWVIQVKREQSTKHKNMIFYHSNISTPTLILPVIGQACLLGASPGRIRQMSNAYTYQHQCLRWVRRMIHRLLAHCVLQRTSAPPPVTEQQLQPPAKTKCTSSDDAIGLLKLVPILKMCCAFATRKNFEPLSVILNTNSSRKWQMRRDCGYDGYLL